MQTRIHTLQTSDDSTIVITSTWNANNCVDVVVDGAFPDAYVRELITFALLDGGEPVGAVLGVCCDDGEWYWADDSHRTNDDADITYTVESITYQ